MLHSGLRGQLYSFLDFDIRHVWFSPVPSLCIVLSCFVSSTTGRKTCEGLAISLQVQISSYITCCCSQAPAPHPMLASARPLPSSQYAPSPRGPSMGHFGMGRVPERSLSAAQGFSAIPGGAVLRGAATGTLLGPGYGPPGALPHVAPGAPTNAGVFYDGHPGFGGPPAPVPASPVGYGAAYSNSEPCKAIDNDCLNSAGHQMHALDFVFVQSSILRPFIQPSIHLFHPSVHSSLVCTTTLLAGTVSRLREHDHLCVSSVVPSVIMHQIHCCAC